MFIATYHIPGIFVILLNTYLNSQMNKINVLSTYFGYGRLVK